MPIAAGDIVGGLARSPGLVAALILLALVAGGSFWWYRTRTPADRLARLLSRRDQVVVLLHPNPDPDAMASGMAVAALAEKTGARPIIQHAGEVRHRENRAFVETLDVQLEQIDEVRGLACREVICVDHNEPRGFAGAGGLSPFAVVDHHPGDGSGTEFTDVRPEYGACATILTEYLRDRGWSRMDLPSALATGLLYGIQQDTNNLTRGCSDSEFEAASFLRARATPEMLDRIANPEMDAETFDVRARAITNRRVEGSFLVSDAGVVSNVDAIAGAADELLRLEGVEVAVVYGEHEGTIHVSARSTNDDVHVGDALRHAVTDIPMADAGGHARMGGGQLSVDHMQGLGPGDGVSLEEFEGLVLTALAGERSAST